MIHVDLYNIKRIDLDIYHVPHYLNVAIYNVSNLTSVIFSFYRLQLQQSFLFELQKMLYIGNE